MKLTFSASVIQFDKDSYKAAVREAIQATFYKAAQKFLLAAIPRIPIWTGFARGAFRNLEDVVGKVTEDSERGYRLRSGRGGGNAIRSPFRRGYYYQGIERTPQSGRQFATPSTDIFNFTGASLASGRTAFYFRFEVNISYFDLLDKAKWGAFKAGSDALQSYIKNNLVLPDAAKFITLKRIT